MTSAVVDAQRRDPFQTVVDAYRTVEDEADQTLPLLFGGLPDGLRGTLYRNGAGKVQVGAVQQMHPFDGDGMVSRFGLTKDGVHYRNRYVRTKEYLAEEAAGTMLYRAFGTNLPGGLRANLLRMRFKNAANTSVILDRSRLLALWEGGVPHALHPESLDTLGREDFDGALRNTLPGRLFTPELPFSAHPSRCPKTGELFNFGLLLGPSPILVVHRVDGRGVLTTRRFPLRRAAFIHDFVLTENYALFFLTPVRFNIGKLLVGLSSPVDAIRQDSRAHTEILVVPRDESQPSFQVSAPSGFFIFHFFGAYEEAGRVVVHGCRMAEFKGGTVDLRDPVAIRKAPFEPGELARWTVDIEARGVDEIRFGGPGLEVPTIDPRYLVTKHRMGWALAKKDLDGPLLNGIARVDLEGGTLKVRELEDDLPGEPLFVPRHDTAPEGEGWLLSVVYRGSTQKSELWVLDATTLETLARFGLPHHQPPGFHGCFVPA